jgi:hypothetical protein
MARIADSKGREDDNSGYTRLLGLPELGQLLSRIHATVIRNGNELELMLAEHCTFRATGLAERLSGALTLFSLTREAFFGEALHVTDADPLTPADIVILDHQARQVRVVEVKEGDLFDTKKADGELAYLRPLALYIGARLHYEPQFQLCCFNQEDKAAILRGLKGRFSPAQVMTGHELCAILGVNYEDIRHQREEDVRANQSFLARELWAIPQLRAAFEDCLAREPVTGLPVPASGAMTRDSVAPRTPVGRPGAPYGGADDG